MRFLKSLALICGLVAPASATYFYSPIVSSNTATAFQAIAGEFDVASSSVNLSTSAALAATKSTFTITLKGQTGTVTATQFVGGGAGVTGVVASSYTAKINGSMIGDGSASGSALGVNGSSVPILSASGFIPNFQIDPSSVAKLSSGLIPNALVDGSSVAKYNASGFIDNFRIDPSSVAKLSSGLIPNALIDSSSITKQGIGISSNCSSGQYLQSMVTTGGVIKGGTCVSAGAGDVTQAGNNAFIGNNTHTGNESFSTATFQHNPWLGSPSSVSIDTSSVGGVLVISVDGASQSSGCVVTMYFDTTRNQMVETSTTTDYTGLSGQVSGVLYEGCAPNTVCKVITRGIVQIKGVSTAITNGITTSSTRCSTANNASSSAGAACGNNHCSGTALTAVSGGLLWAWMAGP